MSRPGHIKCPFRSFLFLAAGGLGLGRPWPCAVTASSSEYISSSIVIFIGLSSALADMVLGRPPAAAAGRQAEAAAGAADAKMATGTSTCQSEALAEYRAARDISTK